MKIDRFNACSRLWAVLSLAIVPFMAHAMYSYELFTQIQNEWGLIDADKAYAFRFAEPVPGEWSTNLQKCKQYAEATGRPLFAVWGKWNCAHCAAFDDIFFQESWKTFMQTPPWNEVIFCYCPGNEASNFPESDENGSDFYWMGGDDSSGGNNWWTTDEFPGRGYIEGFPFVAFYWADQLVDWHADGEYAVADEDGWPAGETTDVEIRIERLKAQFVKWFAGWNGLNKNTGAESFMGGTELDRQEIQQGMTAYVDVPLTRTNNLDRVGTNVVSMVVNGVTSTVATVSWEIGETFKPAAVRVNVPSGMTVGENIILVMTTPNGDFIADTSLAVVDRENSPSNPHWLGEKTEDTLAFGEWTFDWDVATNKVAQYNRTHSGSDRAYTLLLLEGALWCPDCINTDANLFDYVDPNTKEQPFKKWAEENHVALVAIDIPNVNEPNPTGTNYPCLFTYDAYLKVGEMRSGKGYLSRHMIDYLTATNFLAEKLAWISRTTDKGGLIRPELAKKNPYRTSVPSLFLIRDDGSIAGRLTTFGSVGATSYKSAYLSRFDELLAQADDGAEEHNAYWSTTEASLARRGQAQGSICHTDLEDWYKLDDASGQLVSFSLSAKAGASVTLSVGKVENREFTQLADDVSGDPGAVGGLKMEVLIPEGDVYVRVQGSGPYFAVDSDASTVLDYEITTANVLVPTAESQEYVAHEDESTVVMRVTPDKVYYIEGLADVAISGLERRSLNVYAATVTAQEDLALTLAAAGGKVVYLMPEQGFFTNSDVAFKVGETVNARLEAEAGFTEYVDVPLVRTNGLDHSSLTVLCDIYGDKTNLQTVAWGLQEAEKMVRVEIPAAMKAGESVVLEIATGMGSKIADSSIVCVPPVENSSVNPYWFGEKNADTIAFGEWTMDIDVITNKVAKFKAANAGAKAYAIAVIQGSLWCPNCWKMEANMFERAEVKKWALDNNVVYGVVDIVYPPFEYEGSTFPTLVSYETMSVSWAGGSADENLHSGAGYLSRHMARQDDILACWERNNRLVTHSTAEDGWCPPERMSNEWKTGLPVIVLLREDGSIAGRLTEFNWSGPPEYKDYLLYRLDELIALADDREEEKNNDWRSTRAVLGANARVDGFLNANDRVDVYRLDGNNLEMNVALTTEESVALSLEIVAVTDSGSEVVVASTNALCGSSEPPLTLEKALTQEVHGSNLFVRVQGGGREDAGSVFYFWNPDRATRTYRLVTSSVLAPAAELTTYHLGEGETSITITVTEGSSYYISGLGELTGEAAQVLEKSSKAGEENLYYAKSSATLTLAVQPQAQEVVYGIFDSGSFGFTETLVSVNEDAAGGESKTVEFKVARTGSGFGRASIKVAVDLELSDCEPERYIWEDRIVTWEFGETGEKTVSFELKDDQFYDASMQYLHFVIEPTGEGTIDITPNHGRIIFAISENDVQDIGHLSIAGASPAFARKMTAYAVENSTVEFYVVRNGGVSGDVTAKLKLDGVGNDSIWSEEAVWENRTREPLRTISMKMPSYAESKKVAVTLESKDAPVDFSGKVATVYIVPAQAPSFESSSVTVTGYRNCAVTQCVAVVGLNAGGTARISKISGALPSGIKVDLSGDALVVSGSAARAGTYSVSYRVSGVYDDFTLDGSTVTLLFNIGEIPTTAGKSGANVYLAKSRTFRNVPVSLTQIESDHRDVLGRLEGTLSLTIPPNGRASAKFVCAEGTYSYAASGWSEIDVNGTATLNLRSASGDVLVASVSPVDGTVTVLLRAPASDLKRYFTASIADPDWGESSPAAFVGSYNVQLPQNGVLPGTQALDAGGAASLSLRMTESQSKYGVMTFAGVLPDGRTVSGSGTLLPPGTGKTKATYTVFVRGGDTYLAGAFDLAANAKAQQTGSVQTELNQYVYAHASAWPCLKSYDGTRSASLLVYGGYYDAANIGKECDRVCANTGVIGLSIPGKRVASYAWGEAALDQLPVQLAYSDAAPYLALMPGAEVPYGFRFAFNAGTGVYSGTFQIPFLGFARTATFRGVVIPGWGGCGECGRGGLPGPFGGGAFWFSDVDDGSVFVNGGEMDIDAIDNN